MTTFKLASVARAAALALAIGGTGFVAAPVQAQSPNIDFEFRFGAPGFHWRFDTDRRDHRRHCISDRQVRRDLRRDGYRQIRFFDRRGRIVQVIAERRNRDYQIAYDTCSRRIVDRDRI